MAWLALLKPLLDWLLSKKWYVLAVLLGFVVGCKVESWKVHIFGGPEAETRAFGWINDPDEVERIQQTFASRYFGDAAKGIIQAGEDKDALLYKVYRKVAGHDWIPHNQGQVGSCVGQGASGAEDLLSTVQIATGEAHDYQPISAAAAYALSREVGHMLGGGDGSSGAAAAKAMMTMGALSCKEAGDDNADPSIGGKLCKQWGRTGLPGDLKPKAVKHLVKTAANVRTCEEARAALINGYPLTCASNVGFEGRGGFKRDDDGFCRAGGSWSHQMFCGAYRADKKAFLIFQSWGKDSPPGPKSLDQPDGTFWISWQDMERIIKAGETYALSGFVGYPSQNIDVFIRGEELTPREYAVRRMRSYHLAP